mgnify:CR=1 FL=1
MGMIKCKECGEKISKRAKTCPKCGSDKHRRSPLLAIVLLFILVPMAIALLTDDGNVSKRSPGQKQQTAGAGSEKQPAAPAAWTHSRSSDPMTSEVRGVAKSPPTLSRPPMQFPYALTTGKIYFLCDSDSEWAYIEFSKAPNLIDADAMDGYSSLTARVKWDDALSTMGMTQDWGSKVLHFRPYDTAIRKLLTATEMTLELNWHGQGAVLFNFTLNGSTDAMKAARSSCGA